jgi:hypothetical protein
MDEWLAKIGMPSAVVPSPTLDEAGADFLTLSWSWPDAPRGLYEFELRWRPARAPASEVQAQRFGGGTSFTHTLRGLGPGAHHLAVHAVAISGVSAAEKRSSELIAHTGAASGGGGGGGGIDCGGDDADDGEGELRLELAGQAAGSVRLRWSGGGGGTAHFVVYGNEVLSLALALTLTLALARTRRSASPGGPSPNPHPGPSPNEALGFTRRPSPLALALALSPSPSPSP